MLVDNGGFVAPVNLFGVMLFTDPEDFQWITRNGFAVRITESGQVEQTSIPIQQIRSDWNALAGISFLFDTLSATQKQQVQARHGITRADGIASPVYNQLFTQANAPEDQVAMFASLGSAVFVTTGKTLSRKWPPGVAPGPTSRLLRDSLVDPSPPLAQGVIHSITGKNRLKAVGRASHQAEILNIRAGLVVTNPIYQTPGKTVLRFGDERINQQQVNAFGVRRGINRPDHQITVFYTDGSTLRVYSEIEGVPPVRGAYHTNRILLNDPAGRVDVYVVP
jgi:hypothetical protein